MEVHQNITKESTVWPMVDGPTERVNHPPHYNMGPIEVIDAIEAWGLGFNLGNAIKYIARADHKGWPEQDLEKAKWYLEREIERRAKEK